MASSTGNEQPAGDRDRSTDEMPSGAPKTSGAEGSTGRRRRDRVASIIPRAARGVAGLAVGSVAAVRAVGGAAADRTLTTAENALGAALDTALDSPRTQRLVERALARPGLQRLVNSVIGSEVSEHTVDQLLESDEMDRLVGEIAKSPQVREALAAQTLGLANEVGSEVRTRAAAADSLAERIAQRLVGRRPRPEEERTDPPPPSDEQRTGSPNGSD